ncbi:hypothetical protein CRG98_041893 [Punica granatum]|nr:hypothetical protein CRG98_041893 [Punica granatum]
MAQQRALSHHWGSQFPEPEGANPLGQSSHGTSQFSPENVSCMTDIGSVIQLATGSNNDLQHFNTFFSTADIQSYRLNIPNVCKSSGLPVSNGEVLNNFMFSPLGVTGPAKSSVETSMILGPSLIADGSKSSESTDFEGPQQFMGGFSIGLASDMQASMGTGGVGEETGTRKDTGGGHANGQWAIPPRSVTFPFSLPTNMLWDSPPCPSDMSTGFSTNKCYT